MIDCSLLQLPEIEDASPVLRGTDQNASSNVVAPTNLSCRQVRDLSKWLEPIRDIKLRSSSTKNKENVASADKGSAVTQISIEQIPDLIFYISHRLGDFGSRFVLDAPG